MLKIENEMMSVSARWASGEVVWAFPIGANYSWMESFASTLASVDVDILIHTEDDFPPSFSFSSPHLNHLPPDEAWGRATALLTMLNGLLYLEFGPGFRPFSFGRCVDLRTDSNVSVSQTGWVPMDPFPDDVELLRYRETLAANRISWYGRVFFLSRYDEHLQYLMQMFGTDGVTHASLYKALDTMGDAGVSEKSLAVSFSLYGALRQMKNKTSQDKVGMIRRAFETMKRERFDEAGRLALKSESLAPDAIEAEIQIKIGEIENARFTANKFQASGIGSRHGYEKKPVPVKKVRALTLDEAAQVMLPVINAFINERLFREFSIRWASVRATESEPIGPALPAYVP